MRERHVHLTPRLTAALDMLRGVDAVADIGCDHGRLTAALLQQDVCKRVIASDISAESLHKAERLIRYVGLAEKASFRVGDGLSVLQTGEVQAIAMLGIGGTLMTRILETASPEILEHTALVLQPMRAQDDIRRYLYTHRYHITEDRLIAEGKRTYQVFRAVPGTTEQLLPVGWPEDFYDLGYVSFAMQDPLLQAELLRQSAALRKRLAEAKGTEGEKKLLQKQNALRQIDALLTERMN